MKSPPADLLEALGAARRPLVVGHVRPDADCLGAVFAVAEALGQHDGVEPRLFYFDQQVSNRLAFLTALAPRPIATELQVRASDAVIVLDTARADRAAVAPPLAELLADGLPVINVDHHVDNPRFGRVNWVVPTACSTCELVYRVLVARADAVTPAMATLLFAGIHTDTQGFTLPNTTADGTHAAAELVRAGADVAELGERLWRSHSRSEFDLARLVYANTRVTADGRIAYSTATCEEITGVGCTAADIDEQVMIPRSLEGVRIAILFTEGRPWRIRMNFRGEGGVSVLPIAQALGGGGHSAAAGAIVDGAMDDVVARVLEMARKHLG